MSAPGTFSPTGYTFPNGDFFAWGTTANANYAASNSTGWKFVYDSTLSAPGSPNVAQTGLTDSIQGGIIPSNPLTYSVIVGVNIGTSTVLELGSALVASSGNSVLGYGSAAGIRVGVQALSGGTFSFSRNTGAIVSGDAKDSLVGESFGVGSGGIENYSCIVLGGGNDQIYGLGNSSATYGIINWGLIDTGSSAKSAVKKNEDDDRITGNGALVGISNAVLAGISASQQPTILTGVGDDVITGGANAGNNGIYNTGFIDMGLGDDLCQSMVAFQSAANLFGGGGTVVMGSGSDIVQGFGSGTFFGDGFREVLQAKNGKKGGDIDSLYLIAGHTYTVTATTMQGLNNQVINGFDITCADLPGTMKVFGFEQIGTSAATLQPLVASTTPIVL